MEIGIEVRADDVPLVVEALRAYAPILEADGAVEQNEWFAEVLALESLRAGALADELLGELVRAAHGGHRLPPVS